MAGENNKQLDDLFKLWLKATYQKWSSAPWQRAAPSPTSLLCLLQEWFVQTGAPVRSGKGGRAFIRGFKEVRWWSAAQYLTSSSAFGSNVELPQLPSANVSQHNTTC